jgi:hypothetical protein
LEYLSKLKGSSQAAIFADDGEKFATTVQFSMTGAVVKTFPDRVPPHPVTEMTVAPGLGMMVNELTISRPMSQKHLYKNRGSEEFLFFSFSTLWRIERFCSEFPGPKISSGGILRYSDF